MKFSWKLKIELPYDPAIPLLGIYPAKTKTLIQKDTCIPISIAALFTISKVWKQPKCPSTDEWIKMWCMCYACVYMCIHTCIHTFTPYEILVIKKNEILLFATTWMDMEGILLSEISETEKDKYCIFSLICGI